MVPPFAEAHYKDKPVPKRWRVRSIRDNVYTRRIVVVSVLLSIIIWFSTAVHLRDTQNNPIRKYSDYYGDEDLSVESRLFPAGLGLSLTRATLNVQVHPVQNVCFLLDGLTDSDTELVALGCAMHSSMTGANAHFLVLGGGRTSIDEYREVNQFGHEHCQAYFHDARAHSTAFQGRQSSHVYASYAATSLNFLVGHHLPKAIIYTHSPTAPKPNWFLAALAPLKYTSTHIQLERERLGELGWMAKLAPTSLNAWNKPRIDLVVQASSNPASLERLLKSLEAAHYPANQHPNLILDFDYESSESALSIATEMSRVWPSDRLSLRRRVEKSSSSIFEAWYPANDDNYAVILTDQWELNPYFYHYLRSMVLRYQYDVPGKYAKYREKLFGLALHAMHSQSEWQASNQKLQAPVLSDSLDLSTPLLIYPNPFIAFHDSVRTTRSDETMQEAFKKFLVKSQGLVLYPPRFHYDDAEFVLAKHHPLVALPDPDMASPPASIQKQASLQLLTNQDWWRSLGNQEGQIPSWQDLDFFRQDGTKLDLDAFLTDNND